MDDQGTNREDDESVARDWLIPWHPIIGGTSDDGIVQELRSELSHDHVLFGIPVCPIGHRQDCDDCLFQLLDGTNRVAVVHLTYAQHPEPNPIWPETRIFESMQQFVRNEMAPEHESWGTGGI
jgi:hypothetical protein